MSKKQGLKFNVRTHEKWTTKQDAERSVILRKKLTEFPAPY